jgi:hypothetical protein
LRDSSISTSVKIHKCVENLRIKLVLVLAQVPIYRCKNRANSGNCLDNVEYQHDTAAMWYRESIDNYGIVK